MIGGQTLGVAKGATLIPVTIAACDDEYQYGIEFSMMGAIWSMNWIMEQVELRERRAVVNISWYMYNTQSCIIYPYCTSNCTINCASSFEYNVDELMNELQRGRGGLIE